MLIPFAIHMHCLKVSDGNASYAVHDGKNRKPTVTAVFGKKNRPKPTVVSRDETVTALTDRP
jgi:hypothetical protein